MSRHIHLCHLLNPPLVPAGTYVKRGQLLGYVGSTGHSTGPHCHMEGTWNKPVSWYQYPNKLRSVDIQHIYFDPSPFIRDGLPCAFTYKGYGFLAYAPSEGGYHLGVDINSPNDLGKPVMSPVNGRVQFSEGVHWLRSAVGKLFPSVFNHGFGNHIWIECDEANLGVRL